MSSSLIQPEVQSVGRDHAEPFWGVYLWALLAAALQTVLLFCVAIPYLDATSHGLYSVGFVDDYEKLAYNIAQGNGYRFFPETSLTLAREPGYPLLLAAAFKLFGYGITSARIANVILLCVSCCLLVTLARRVSNKVAVALWAVVLFLIHPGTMVAEMRGGVEMLFTALLLAFALAVQVALERKTLGHYALAGLILGVTCSVRSTVLLFPLLLPVISFFFERPRPAVGQLAARALVLYAVAAAVLAPWTYRNYKLVDAFVPTASVQGVAAHAGQYICEHLNLDHGYLELDIAAGRERRGISREQRYNAKYGYYIYFYDPKDELRFNRALGASVMQRYAQDPALFARCTISNVFNFWFSGKTWKSTWLNVAVQVPYLLLGAFGLRRIARAKRVGEVAILVAVILYLMMIHIPIHSQARYSVPLIPFISILGAAFLASCRASRDALGSEDRRVIDAGART